jgi:hypothetical protein
MTSYEVIEPPPEAGHAIAEFVGERPLPGL